MIERRDGSIPDAARGHRRHPSAKGASPASPGHRPGSRVEPATNPKPCRGAPLPGPWFAPTGLDLRSPHLLPGPCPGLGSHAPSGLDRPRSHPTPPASEPLRQIERAARLRHMHHLGETRRLVDRPGPGVVLLHLQRQPAATQLAGAALDCLQQGPAQPLAPPAPDRFSRPPRIRRSTAEPGRTSSAPARARVVIQEA